MKRIALLIGPNYQDLPGVRADIDAWKIFLTSPIGGGWYNNEIIDVSEILSDNKLSLKTLEPFLNQAGEADYCFIAFSGHGGIYDTRREPILGNAETFIYLNDEDVPVSEYEVIPNGKCKRITLILDCCRTLDKNIVGFAQKKASLESREIMPKIRARIVFDMALEQCEYGLTQIYSVHPMEEADDKNSFSRLMMKASENAINSNPNVNIITLKEATGLAIPLLRMKRVFQTPVYNGGRRRFHFPFAIKI